jgi:hypothetical protein
MQLLSLDDHPFAQEIEKSGGYETQDIFNVSLLSLLPKKATPT